MGEVQAFQAIFRQLISVVKARWKKAASSCKGFIDIIDNKEKQKS
jgi:hypothetical protein